MQNTCSCLSCDGSHIPYLRTMTVLGHPLTVRNVECSCDGLHYGLWPAHRQLMLTILITNWCPAHCPFCIAGDHSARDRVDPRKLETVLRALKAEDAIDYIAISGGEPMADPQLLDEVLCLIYEVFGTRMMVGVTTNGINLNRIHTLHRLMDLDRFRISRHHWDDARNRELFGITVPGADQLREVISGTKAQDLFAINCLLLRDWVGTHEAIRRQLDFVGSLGPALAAFITPTPVNDFTRIQRVDFHQILRRDDPDLMFTKGYYEMDTCHCQDGVAVTYAGHVVEFYGRTSYTGSPDYVRGLVYGADNVLRAGYGGQILAQPGREAP